MKSKPLSVDIGIPTHLGGNNLELTISSILSLKDSQIIRAIYIVCDGTSQDEILRLRQLRTRDKRIILKVHKEQKGQSARINEIFRSSTADLLVLTNDDVILDKYSMSHFVNTHLKKNAELMTSQVKSLGEKNLIQKILSFALSITQQIVISWNDGVNYLACNGRMIALSRSLYTKVVIPELLWNNDAFIYLFAKKNKFKIAHCNDAIVRFKLPSNIKEHFHQSLKFQSSLAENNNFLEDISVEYKIPKNIVIHAIITKFFQNPILTIGYLIVNLFTRGINVFYDFNPGKSSHWITDVSTKNLV